MTSKNLITLTVGNYTGTAEIKWIKETPYTSAHYGAFITVPFQDSRWENLFVYAKDNLSEAIEKGKCYLEMALSRCTLC